MGVSPLVKDGSGNGGTWLLELNLTEGSKQRTDLEDKEEGAGGHDVGSLTKESSTRGSDEVNVVQHL